MPIINPSQPSSAFPLLPTGSLIGTNSKFGHELIAGPVIGDQQVVGHKEPGFGTHLEMIDSAAQRHPFTQILPPISNDHGVMSWSRMERQLGEQWGPLDNCQHAAREAYYGVRDSPTVTGIAVVGLTVFFLWLANQN